MLSHRRGLAVALAFLGATALLVVHGAYFDYYADDSYITLRYSKHLADGLGPNWNSVGRVEGYTNFLWMAILAGLGKLTIDLVDASRAFGFLSLLGTFVAVSLIWRLWRDEDNTGIIRHPVILATVLLGIALTDSVAFWGFSGMETPLFMALITSSAYFYFREQRGAAFPWSAVALAAASMTRPEGLVAVGVTGAFVLFDSTKLPRRDALRHLLPWAAAFLSLYGPFFIWRYSYYGYLFPNTYYAKVGLTVDALDRGLRDLATSGLEYHLLAMVVGTIVLLTHERLRQDALYILALAGGLIAAMVVEGDVGGAHNRFIGIVFPLLFLGGVSGLATLLKRAALPRSHHIALASVALTLGALALLPASYDPLLPLGQEGIERRSRLGAWFNEYTPADYRIADFAIGAISYHAIDRDFIDLLGLSDVTIAHTEVPDMGAGIAGHEKYNIDYVFEEARPEIIVTGEVRERPFSAAELRPLLIDRAATPAALRLFADTRLWDRYTLRAVELEGLWYHFMQRNDTVAELQDPGLN